MAKKEDTKEEKVNSKRGEEKKENETSSPTSTSTATYLKPVISWIQNEICRDEVHQLVSPYFKRATNTIIPYIYVIAGIFLAIIILQITTIFLLCSLMMYLRVLTAVVGKGGTCGITKERNVGGGASGSVIDISSVLPENMKGYMSFI